MREGLRERSTTHWRCFLYARQNEVKPNQANKSVKQIATAMRLAAACPARYSPYSRISAIPPNTAMKRKTVPVTSSHSWCAARPNVRPAVRTAPQAARSMRLRPACSPATRAATPNFRTAETLLTVLDFNSTRRYNDPTTGYANDCDAVASTSRRTVLRLRASNFRAVVRGTSGSATQATHERTRRRH